MLQSLAYGLPIVSPAYFDAYITAAREHQMELPNVNDFVPVITEPFIIKEPNMMIVQLDRQRLFQNKTFVFMSKHQFAKFQPIITLAAGKCLVIGTDKVKKSFLSKPECIPVQYTPISNTQCSSDVEDIVKHINSNGRRLISESEIGLAIIHRSTDRFCNPDRKFVPEPNSNAVNTADILNNILINATPHDEHSEPPPPSNSHRIPESADLTGTEPNNNDGNKPSPRKSARLSTKNVSTGLPDRLMPPPPVPQPSTSKQKRKHCEQTSAPQIVEADSTESVDQDKGQVHNDEPTSKKQKTNANDSQQSQNDSGENCSGQSESIANPTPVSASQQSVLNFSGFISTQKRRNRTQLTATSQAAPLTPSRLIEKAKENRKRAINMLNSNSDDENNDEDNDDKMFNFNRTAKRAKVMNKDSQGKSGRNILEANDDDDDDDEGFSFNFSRKRNTQRQSQAKRKNTEDEMSDVVDGMDNPSQATYKKPYEHAMNRSLNRTIKPIDFVPAQICDTNWIVRKMKNELILNEKPQSSDSVKIKTEPLDESEMTDQEKKQKWIKSMANVFSIRKIDVDLTRSRCAAADETDNSATSNVLNKTKNFKKFVKVNFIEMG